MRKEIIVAGHLSKSNWGGQYQPREQDFVIDENGICMSIPSSYERHPFKVLVYEELQDMAQTTRILRGGDIRAFNISNDNNEDRRCGHRFDSRDL